MSGFPWSKASGKNKECVLWEICYSFVSFSHAGDHFATRNRSFIALLLSHPITNGS
jgi:hypothetical protein